MDVAERLGRGGGVGDIAEIAGEALHFIGGEFAGLIAVGGGGEMAENHAALGPSQVRVTLQGSVAGDKVKPARAG